MWQETGTGKLTVDGKTFTCIFQNDGELFQTLIYRADAIELFDIEGDITCQGAYACEQETIAHIRSFTYLWNN